MRAGLGRSGAARARPSRALLPGRARSAATRMAPLAAAFLGLHWTIPGFRRAVLAAADRYERLAKDLGPMEFSSEQMAKHVAEYASVLTATAQSLRTIAAALDANKPAEADRANHELERLAIRERSAVSHMDAWCQ